MQLPIYHEVCMLEELAKDQFEMSPSQPSTAQGADLPPQQRRVMHTL